MKAQVQLTHFLEEKGIMHALEPLMTYLELLSKWNSTYNLTAIRDDERMITHHLLDSLVLLPWIHGPRLLDVGTGAGLPGLPLAIADSSLSVVLLDSNGKKTRFLHHVKRVLQLNHLEIVQSRVETYHPSSAFDTVVSRAFSDLKSFVNYTRHLVADNGIWLAMKGRYPEEELTAIPDPYRVESYTVPGIEGERCCVVIKNALKE